MRFPWQHISQHRQSKNEERKRAFEFRDSIFERDGGKCLQCGGTDNLTVDHIVPVGQGGTSDPHNLQTLCRDCNRVKGQRIMDFRRAQL